jgi:uncharacterized protein (TIRG00374 family)
MGKRRIFKWILFILSAVLGVGLFVGLFIKQDPAEILNSLLTFGWLPFIGFIGISLLNFTFYAWRWQLIINAHLKKGQKISLWQVYKHRMGGYAISYLTPAAQVGGEPVRIALLATEKGMTGKVATSSALLDISFELVAYVVFIIAGVALAFFEGLGDGNSFTIIGIGLGVLLIFLFSFFGALRSGRGFFVHIFRATRLNKIKRLKSWEKNIVDTENMMTTFLSKNPRLIGGVVTLSFLMISFRVIEAFYIAFFLGVAINFGQAFLMSTLPGIALLLPVPGGLGVFEGSYAGIFGILAIPLNAVAFALVIRARDLIFILLGLGHIFSYGRKFLHKMRAGE